MNMTTTDPDVLGPADDNFHAAVREPDTWTETSWFCAQVPERGLGLWMYPVFRPGLGILACTIYAWGPGTTEPWELPYWRCWWHMPIPQNIQPTAFELPNGLRYRVREPMTAYELSYPASDGLSFDLSFTAIHDPHPLGVGGGIGHLDQLGRLQGEMVLHGEHIEIDCIEMRDRTWGPRRENRQETCLGYSYGATADGSFAFHASTRLDRHTGEWKLMTGFVLGRGDSTRMVASVARTVTRDERGRPTAVKLTIVDDQGESLHVTGTVVSLLSHIATPFFVWVSLVRWRLPDGREAFGEDQDTWSPGKLRSFLTAYRAGETTEPGEIGR
jgi:hypothetical protein